MPTHLPGDTDTSRYTQTSTPLTQCMMDEARDRALAEDGWTRLSSTPRQA